MSPNESGRSKNGDIAKSDRYPASLDDKDEEDSATAVDFVDEVGECTKLGTQCIPGL